jgi:adenylate cyclase
MAKYNISRTVPQFGFSFASFSITIGPLVVIALELDTDNDFMQIIRDEVNKRTQEIPLQTKLGNPFINKLYLDAVIDIDSVIKNSQIRTWKALKGKPESNL